jgi:hypothetical protein
MSCIQYCLTQGYYDMKDLHQIPLRLASALQSPKSENKFLGNGTV